MSPATQQALADLETVRALVLAVHGGDVEKAHQLMTHGDDHAVQAIGEALAYFRRGVTGDVALSQDGLRALMSWTASGWTPSEAAPQGGAR